jgi:4-hydroxy-4-methyl-2-oxoglutarate aldolase
MCSSCRPAGRSDVAPRVGGPVLFGGVRVQPRDIVLADDDGIVIAPLAQLEACLERAVQIERTEAAVLAGIEGGASLIEMTNLVEHVAALRRSEISTLAITPPS